MVSYREFLSYSAERQECKMGEEKLVNILSHTCTTF